VRPGVPRSPTGAGHAQLTTVPAVTTRTFWRGLIAAAAVGLAVRLAYILVVRHDVAPGGDAFFYHLGARLLVEGHGFIEPTPFINGIVEQSASHPPLYLLYLAIPSSVGLDGPVLHMVWSSFVGVGTVVVVGLTGREVAGPRAGLIAAGIAAVYPNLWVFDGFILSETMSMFTAILAVFLAYRFLRTPTPWRVAVLGFACGVASLARAELVLLVPLLLLPCLLITRAVDGRRKLKWLAAGGLAALIPIAPWVTFNMTRFDRPVFLSTGLEPTMLGANCDATYYGNLIGYFTPQCTESVRYKPGDDQSERNAESARIVREYVWDHKARAPVVVLARWGRVTGLFRPGQQLKIDQGIEGREGWVALAALWSFYAVAALAITGAVILRRRRVKVFPLLVPPAIVLFAVALALGSNRYRASAEPALVVLAAVAIGAGLDAVQRRRSRDTATRAEQSTAETVAVGAATTGDGG
jgi:4-amino-4-deoxy-L-arabinose transferase-like glycosyltransferase